MSGDGPDFYDEADTHETYTAHRAFSSSANEVLDRPVIEDLIGDVRGLDILDLGCGLGEFGAWVLAKGCASYTGLDGSERMIAAARTALEGTYGQLIQGDIRTWDYPRSKFDLVVSRLALHYVEDLKDPLSAIHRALRDSGRLVFSVEHPVITSSDESSRAGGKRGSWIVDRYFQTGLRRTRWMGSEVSKYHRTVEDYFSLVQQAGFTVESVRESRPIPKYIPDPVELKRRQRIPLMLFLAGRRLDSN